MAKRDYYEVLGVDKNSTEMEIKKAYRQMALKYHPDKNPDNKEAEDKFKEAAEAYDVLSNPDKKRKYDQFGHQGVGSQGFESGNVNMDDIFSHFGDIFGGQHPFGDMFEFMSGGRGGRNNRGRDLQIKLKLSLIDIANGVNKKIKLNKMIPCHECNGTGAEKGSSFKTCKDCNGSGRRTVIQSTPFGRMQSIITCNNCDGTGQIITNSCKHCNGLGIENGEEVININIPPGVSNGMKLSLGGKGNAAPHKGNNGDLIIDIEEIEDPQLQREGNNLLYELYISMADAALGCSLEIPTIDAKAKIKIDAGTQSGKILRLKGKGLPPYNGYQKGDLLVNINIWTPQSLSHEEKAIMEKLKNSENFKPNPGKRDKGFFDRMRDIFS